MKRIIDYRHCCSCGCHLVLHDREGDILGNQCQTCASIDSLIALDELSEELDHLSAIASQLQSRGLDHVLLSAAY